MNVVDPMKIVLKLHAHLLGLVERGDAWLLPGGEGRTVWHLQQLKRDAWALSQWIDEQLAKPPDRIAHDW